MSITSQAPYQAHIIEEKRKRAVLTESLEFEDMVAPMVLEVLMGWWTWAMLLFRPALAIPNAVYHLIHSASSRRTPWRMWNTFKWELMAIASLSVFFTADLL